MPNPPANQSRKKVSSSSPAKSGVAPTTVRTTAALAWLVAAASFLRAAGGFLGDGQGFADSLFFIGLGGGAAYLGMALPRRVVAAWRTCRQLAAAAGTINLVVLPSLVVACLITLSYSLWRGVEAAPAEWAATLAAATAATALPWAFYHALGDDRVRGWFCVADCK